MDRGIGSNLVDLFQMLMYDDDTAIMQMTLTELNHLQSVCQAVFDKATKRKRELANTLDSIREVY